MKIVNKEAFNQNCYLVSIDNQLVAIDPGYSYDEIKIKLENQKLDMILITHYHFDHVGAVNALCEEFNIKAYIHQAGYELVQKSKMALYFGFPLATVKAKHLATFTNKIAELPSLKIIHAPGHSQDSSLFLIDKQLFTGDVLFINGPGRVDGPDASKEDMQTSLQAIKELENDLTIYPGHGPAANLGILKKMLPQYIAMLNNINKKEK